MECLGERFDLPPETPESVCIIPSVMGCVFCLGTWRVCCETPESLCFIMPCDMGVDCCRGTWNICDPPPESGPAPEDLCFIMPRDMGVDCCRESWNDGFRGSWNDCFLFISPSVMGMGIVLFRGTLNGTSLLPRGVCRAKFALLRVMRLPWSGLPLAAGSLAFDAKGRSSMDASERVDRARSIWRSRRISDWLWLICLCKISVEFKNVALVLSSNCSNAVTLSCRLLLSASDICVRGCNIFWLTHCCPSISDTASHSSMMSWWPFASRSSKALRNSA